MARQARLGEINYPAFDRFSLAHGFVGAMLGIAGVSGPKALALTIAWELAEPTIKRQAPTIFPRQSLDTPANKLGDGAAWMAGWALGRAITR
jgi:hypothetical protein